PLTLSAALAMTWLGTDGETGRQLSQVLVNRVWDASDHWDVANTWRQIIGEQTRSHNGVRIHVANHIYVDHKITIRPDFKQTLISMFEAKVTKLDIQNEPEVAVNVINEDISEATNGKIHKLVDHLDRS